MKNILIIFPVLAVMLLQSCAPTMDYTWSKDNFKEQKINKIAVVVVSKNQAIRQSVESEIASDLRAEGIDAITSISTFLPVNASKEDWTTDAIAKQLEKLGCDAAIGISLINQKDRTDYVPGQSYYSPIGYYRYGRNMYTNYNNVYSPGYYENTKQYIVESNLYNLTISTDAENAMVWKGQSSVYNPSSIDGGATSYAKNLVGYLVKNNIILSTKK